MDERPAQTTRTSGLLFHPEQGSSRSHLLPAFVESPGPQNLNLFHTPTRTPLSLSRSRPTSPSLSPTVSPPAPPPQPLPAPIPQRPAGGEIHRIRMQMAADQAAQMQEMEARRPEYLRRLKRRLSDSGSRPRPPRQEEDPTPGLGVVDSPHKGRRLMFFQETSEESFEQSLLAGGYPSYGVTPAYGEPSTPKSGQFKRTMEIIQQSTPGYRPPSPPKDNLVELSINLEDARKRRRIEAFREHEPLESSIRLFAGEVEGMGRVLVNPDTVHFSKVQPAPHPPETPPRQPETPTKKRNSRRKRGGVTDSPSRKKVNVADVAAEPQEPPRPDWPDNAFPWALRIQEREAEMKRREDERLECIARYLERESDEDDQDDQSLHLPPEPAEESPPLPPRKRGRGKAPAAVVKREPDPPPILRDDMADAVAALRLSLRCRPAVTAAPRNRTTERWICSCGTPPDRSLQVQQCWSCRNWFHPSCVGLPRWAAYKWTHPYCSKRCRLRDPNVEERPRELQIQLAKSAVRFAKGAVPPERATPRGGPFDTTDPYPRSPWAESSDVGPVTPSTAARSAVVHRTPSAFDPLDDTWDPTATPSRTGFTGPFTTPKWPMLMSSQPGRIRSGFPPQYYDDDSPVRRSEPRASGHQMPRYQESPLASFLPTLPPTPGSPLARMSKAKSRS